MADCIFCNKPLLKGEVVETYDNHTAHSACVEEEFRKLRVGQKLYRANPKQAEILRLAHKAYANIFQVKMFDDAVCNTEDGIQRGMITQINTKGITMYAETRAYNVKWRNVIDVIAK